MESQRQIYSEILKDCGGNIELAETKAQAKEVYHYWKITGETGKAATIHPEKYQLNIVGYKMELFNCIEPILYAYGMTVEEIKQLQTEVGAFITRIPRLKKKKDERQFQLDLDNNLQEKKIKVEDKQQSQLDLEVMIHQGDALEVLKTFKSETIDSCITSPPYWNLRDYGVRGQLGLEPTYQEYITRLCDIFDQVKRVLKEGGSCWVVTGDTFNDKKSLTMIPERFATEMTSRGWNEVIWYKPKVMPSSAKDRFTVEHEMVYFTKSKKYYFDTQYEPMAEISIKRGEYKVGANNKTSTSKQGIHKPKDKQYDWEKLPGRIKRTVWKISPGGYKGAHFAVFPPKLIETPILSTCPSGGLVLDCFCGSGTTGLVAIQNNRRFIGIELK